MTSFCAVCNEKVVRPSPCGEEAVCTDHYGHLEEENTVSGKVGPSSPTQCASGSGSKTKKERLYSLSHISSTPWFLNVLWKTSGKGWCLFSCRHGLWMHCFFWAFFIGTGSSRMRLRLSVACLSIRSTCSEQQVWGTWSPGKDTKK